MRKKTNSTMKAFLKSNVNSEITQENFDTKLGIALNNYNRTYDIKDSKSFLLEFRNDIKDYVNKLSDKEYSKFSSLGFTCKFLIDNNIEQTFHQKTFLWIEEKIEEIKEISLTFKEEVKEDKRIGNDVQKAILNQVREKLGEIDKYFEDYITETETNFNLLEYIQSCNFSIIHVRKIYNYYLKQQKELQDAFESVVVNKYNSEGIIEDSLEGDLKESYRFFGKVKFRKVIEFYEENLEILDNYCKLNSTKRTKVIKKTSIKKLISKVNYLKESIELGITSLSPDKIIKSSVAILYNEKYRKLQIYFAKENKKLEIKGTSILNFDETTSCCKTIRENINLVELIQKSKTGFIKEFQDIKTKCTECTGRINKETLILKVF